MTERLRKTTKIYLLIEAYDDFENIHESRPMFCINTSISK